MTTKQDIVGSTERIIVDAEDLIMALRNHDCEFEYFLDRTTGEILFLGEEDLVEENSELRSLIEDNPTRFLTVEPGSSSEGWQIMVDFIEQFPSGEIRDRLMLAVQHSKPFRRFKDALLNYPDVRDDWFAFEYRKMLELAREWLHDEEVEAELKTRDSTSTSLEN